MRRTTLLFLTLAATLATASFAVAKVHAVSTDGEATVYVARDFTGDFDVSYDVRFPPSPRNRSWTVVGLLLLGKSTPSGSIGVGLSRGSPREATLSGFTDVSTPKAAPVYRSIPVSCASKCTIELRGTRTTISALIAHRVVGAWSRKTLALVHPYLQINGEVSAAGDRISARLLPIRTKTGKDRFAPPTCAFTTQGVHAYAAAGAGVVFTGRRNPRADATYVSLLTGKTGDSCGDV